MLATNIVADMIVEMKIIYIYIYMYRVDRLLHFLAIDLTIYRFIVKVLCTKFRPGGLFLLLRGQYELVRE